MSLPVSLYIFMLKHLNASTKFLPGINGEEMSNLESNTIVVMLNNFSW